jgi:DNA-binding PadR family transcriptional regulator
MDGRERRKRRQYELTKRGRIELGDRSHQWRRFAQAVDRVLARTAPLTAAPRSP